MALLLIQIVKMLADVHKHAGLIYCAVILALILLNPEGSSVTSQLFP